MARGSPVCSLRYRDSPADRRRLVAPCLGHRLGLSPPGCRRAPQSPTCGSGCSVVPRQASWPLKIGTQLGLLSSWPPPSEEVLTCWAQDLRPSSGLPPPFWIFSGSWRHPQPTMLPEALLGRGCGYLMGQRLYLRSCPGSHLALGPECSLHLLGHRAWEPPGGPKWSSFSQLLLGPLPALGRP